MTVYFGAWENDKRTGYGVFEDTVRQVYCVANGSCTDCCMCDIEEVSNHK